MSTNEGTPERAGKIDKGPGAKTIVAAVVAVIAVALVFANTARVDVNFLVYRAENIQLWWFTLLVVFFTLVTDRLVLAALRRRKNKKKT